MSQRQQSCTVPYRTARARKEPSPLRGVNILYRIFKTLTYLSAVYFRVESESEDKLL